MNWWIAFFLLYAAWAIALCWLRSGLRRKAYHVYTFPSCLLRMRPTMADISNRGHSGDEHDFSIEHPSFDGPLLTQSEPYWECSRCGVHSDTPKADKPCPFVPDPVEDRDWDWQQQRKRAEAAESRVRELEKALEFYAQQYGVGARLASDGGMIARAALAKETEA